MKSYKNLYDQLLDKELISKAIDNAAKHKKSRYDVKKILVDKDRYVDEIYNDLVNEVFEPCKPNCQIIDSDSKSRKRRVIYKPKFFKDQIIHHCVVLVMQKYILKSMVTQAYGSIPNRGIHKGAKVISKWIVSSNYKATKYCFKFDIRHFYENIDITILKNLLSRKFKDARFLTLLFKIIDSHPAKGIPLGNYTSQWFAMVYLTDFDHYVKEVLHVKYYLRYMDDVIILDGNKRRLKKIKTQIIQYLSEKLNLTLKSNYQLFPIIYTKQVKTSEGTKVLKSHGRPIDMLGYKFYRNKIILRKYNWLSLKRLSKRLATIDTNNITSSQVASYFSRLGMTKVATVYYALVDQIYSLFDKGSIDNEFLRSRISIAAAIKVARHKRKQNGLEKQS